MIRLLYCKLVLLLLSTCLVEGYSCFAQPNYRFHHYSTTEGLASETVEQIVQDSLGFIWITSTGGISKFDGYEFKVYQYDPADQLKSPYDKPGMRITLDSKGNLWGYRTNTEQFILLRYDQKLDGFVRYFPKINSAQVKGYAMVNGICFDNDGETIWLATIGRGLHKYNYASGEVQSFTNPHPDSVTNFKNNWHRAGHIWGSQIVLASPNGVWLFDKVSGEFSRPPCSPKDTIILYNSSLGRTQLPDLKSQGMWYLVDDGTWVLIDREFKIVKKFRINDPQAEWPALDSQGNFWFTTIDKGLIKYNIDTEKWTNIQKDISNPYSLRANWLTNIAIDRDGNIWIGTREEGVSVLRKQSLAFYNYAIRGPGHITLYNEEGLDRIVLIPNFSYTENFQGDKILTATIPAGNPGEIKWETINLNQALKGHIEEVHKGKNHLWISAFGYGVTGLPIDPISKKILAAPISKITTNTSNQNTIGFNTTIGIYEDKEERLWIATVVDGLTRVNNIQNYGGEGSATHFRYSKDNTSTISNDFLLGIFPLDTTTLVVQSMTGFDFIKNNKVERVIDRGVSSTMYKSEKGVIYLGAVDGLYVLENNSMPYRFKKIKEINKEVQKITEDKLGRLWMSNLEGIMCYEPLEKVLLFFGKEEGIDHTHEVIYKSSNDKMITSDIEGFTVFDPLTMVIDRKKTSPMLTRLKVNNEVPDIAGYPGKGAGFKINSDITVLDELVLDYLHNNFTVEFSSMQMTAPEKNRYRHMLKDYDHEWIESDYRNRSATYTNLPPGDYEFKVKASNHHGVWNDNEKTLKVKILPPPWRTWWAYTGYLMLVAGLLVWARSNIVKQERLHASLQLAKVEQEKEHFEFEKAKEVDKIKSSFFTNISHEFRTPLTLIKGPVQDLLEKYTSDPKTQQKLKMVQRNSDLLLKLINQLLDLAKLESGTLKLEKSEGDLYSFIRAIASSFSSFASQKNIIIHVDVPAESCHANFDKDKLETILINLVNNAIKFTPSNGSVTVKASVEETAGTQGCKGSLTLKVSDTGIGISEEQQSKIFERFHQVSEAHKEVGTGVGLSLVKELVALMEGEISVQSEVGKGSTFEVSLPIEIATSRELQAPSLSTPTFETLSNNLDKTARSSQLETRSLEKPTVLVVEDNTDVRSFIIDSLGDEFYFLEAENGRIGLEVATREVPDLIISDVMMPEMDGITMAGKIKSDVHTSHIPLILLTAKSTEDSKLSGLQSGADDYLTKPFNKNELLLKVRNGMNRQLKLREKLRAELMSTAPKVEVLSADEKFLKEVKENILKRLSDEKLSVESLAESMNMSRVHLYRKISGLTDMTVNELIRKLRLQRAAQLLQQKWGPVSQVAYEVGFSNLSYFSKVFKEEFGALPSEYQS